MPDMMHASGGRETDDAAIAIIGMAGRFPGAADTAAFRAMLLEGRSGIQRLDRAADESPLVDEPGYVPARGVLDGADLFDAELFGLAPTDAAMLDPQQRVFLECCWAALEEAGHAPQGPSCATAGVFASASMATHWLRAAQTMGLSGLGGVAGVEKDLLAGRVAYHLGLGGPAMGVQTACSSSLAAVHVAAQSLIAGECDLALAGGVSITVPLRMGYLYQPGGIGSPDGACRPFTAAGAGTVKGDGAGVVVLRRLADALADGDAVRAVILGTAVTNDGRARAGFAAPGIPGQARAIRAALHVAGVHPAAIGYVEGHGTATQVGDAIELRALAEVFGPAADPDDKPVLGAAKAHVGHLDAAAGIAGLISAVLALETGVIAPALHRGPPHPELAASGFALAQAARPWPSRAGPRRAGVSAFGLGGTNVHVVLEQPPAPPPRAALPGPHPLVLSARTRDGLAALASATGRWLGAHPQADLADVAHTLARGRAPLSWRLLVTADSVASAQAALASAPVMDSAAPWPSPPVARRIGLPGTQFARTRHWLDDAGPAPPIASCPTERLLAAGWRNQPPPPARNDGPWLVLAAGRAGAALASALRAMDREVAAAGSPADLPGLAASGFRPATIVHALALKPPSGGDAAAVTGVPAWIQALAPHGWLEGTTLLFAASQAVALGGERALQPFDAGLEAAAPTLAAEHPGLASAFVDIGPTEDAAACLLAEQGAPDPAVAWRHGRRWVRDWQPVPSGAPAPLRPGGVWLITGGTGGIGLLLAKHLARRCGARLLLAGRTGKRPGQADALATVAGLGGSAEIVPADLAEPGAAARLVDHALQRHGALHGVVHAAGLADGGMILGLRPEQVAAHLAVKPAAALQLAEALAGRPLDRFVLCGSHAGPFGAFGQYGYAAANAALAGVAEALAASGRKEAVAVHWDRWQGVGMAAQAEARHLAATGEHLPGGLDPEAALALFDRALAAPPSAPVLLATSRPVDALVAERKPRLVPAPTPSARSRQPRPAHLPAATPPTTAAEAALAALWEAELGFTPIGVDDDFVALGGDSLNALRICGAARSGLGLLVPLRALMEARTIRRLAARPQDAGEAASTSAPGFAEEIL